VGLLRSKGGRPAKMQTRMHMGDEVGASTHPTASICIFMHPHIKGEPPTHREHQALGQGS